MKKIIEPFVPIWNKDSIVKDYPEWDISNETFLEYVRRVTEAQEEVEQEVEKQEDMWERHKGTR